MTIQQAIQKLAAGEHLTTEEMVSVMRQLMTGEATQAQIGGFLVALHIRGETVEEITGAAQVMRELVTPVNIDAPYLVDTCGTGGDGARLFNVSTAAALVVAAAGGHVAKHGNRSVTSSTGSADLLEAAGVNLQLKPDQVARCIKEVGVGFMFAPSHHGAMKYAIGPRKELAMRTIFNVLGPITNPAGVKRQVLGVFDGAMCEPLAEVLQRLGSERVMVVHAEDGLDEFSIAAPTQICEVKGADILTYHICPEDVGLTTQDLSGLAVDTAEESLALIRGALGKRETDVQQKAADMIALNAGAAIYIAGISDTLANGVAMAEDAIGSGLAYGKLTELVDFTACFTE